MGRRFVGCPIMFPKKGLTRAFALLRRRIINTESGGCASRWPPMNEPDDVMKTQLSTKPIGDDNQAPPLEIRFQFVDGSVANFFQPEPEIAENIWSRISVASLFTRPRIVIADDYSKSVFVCSQINRIDFVFAGSDFSQIPRDHADLV